MDEILKLFGGTENIWAAIKDNAGVLGKEATRTMLELFYVLKSPETGMLNKTMIVAALGYQLLPEDVLPRSKFGLLGLVDNGAALALAYNRVKASVTPEIKQQVNNIVTNWFDDESNQQNWIPSAHSHEDDDQQNSSQQRQDHFTPTMENRQNPPSTHRQPIWDDDEDVVID